ncbi:MAG: hypothetical protein J6K25_04695 [Thermoguttaceae bacterium]|nr:hypothetical protein [Thermoguttaceae bacterium]
MVEMKRIKNFFTDDGNLKAITFGLMAGTSLTALIAVAALVELEWNGTRAIADFFGFESIKQNVAIDLALAFASSVLFWVECHRIEHKCIMRLIELRNREIDSYCLYVDQLTKVILEAPKPNKEKRAKSDSEGEK